MIWMVQHKFLCPNIIHIQRGGREAGEKWVGSWIHFLFGSHCSSSTGGFYIAFLYIPKKWTSLCHGFCWLISRDSLRKYRDWCKILTCKYIWDYWNTNTFAAERSSRFWRTSSRNRKPLLQKLQEERVSWSGTYQLVMCLHFMKFRLFDMQLIVCVCITLIMILTPAVEPKSWSKLSGKSNTRIYFIMLKITTVASIWRA